jgi:hypothetical protein
MLGVMGVARRRCSVAGALLPWSEVCYPTASSRCNGQFVPVYCRMLPSVCSSETVFGPATMEETAGFASIRAQPSQTFPLQAAPLY